MRPIHEGAADQKFTGQWHKGKFADLDSGELDMGDSVRRMRGAIDTTLIPPGTQYRATRSKAGKGNRLIYAGFANPCKSQQHLTDHS